MSAEQQRDASGAGDPAIDALPAAIGARYEVLERLGRGGSAIVYRVRGRGAAHDVALKQLVSLGSDRERGATSLFEREFHVLAQLRHPSVIEVYDYGIDPSGPYYTMELLDGGDLSAQAPLPFESACKLMLQVCSSLSLLHSRRLLHRDISPRNVRCTRAGVAKLIDFGAMVPMGPCLHGVGTPAFVAPEVVHHLSLDARTDLFSLGATLYFALTGRRAFAARSMAELNEAWRVDPIPPGRLVQGIPAALDELVISLLRIDPARRPRSAFEVMQRLAAAAGVEHVESEEISRAYLSTPTLVGREVEQRRFRQCLRHAAQSDGCALLFEGASGMGRSRLLDVCMLEAKTAGATVLRLDGASARHEPFASAHRLAEQLREAAPDSPQQGLADPALFARLFSPQSELVSREQLKAEPYSAQAALLAWFRSACQRRLLILAIDDLDRIDDASLALMLALVHGAADCQLLLVATLTPRGDEAAASTLGIVRQRSTTVALEPLTAAQTEALFASIFFDAPHVALVSHHIHQLAAGRPRDAMALVQHLVDQKRVRYADGNWILPGEMVPSDLPTSAEEALRLRIAELPPLARELVEAQALALEDAWTRADYLALAPGTDPRPIDQALATLLHHGVLVGAGETYALSRLGAGSCLVAQLSAADTLRHQLALAEMAVRTGRPRLIEVHHLLAAQATDRALDRLAPQLSADATAIAESSGLPRKTVCGVIEQACFAAQATGRPPREINDLLRILVGFSATERAFFDRYAPRWLDQVEHDSGLRDYATAGDQLPPAARLQQALQRASARYEALPERERVYRVEEALTCLARYVNVATVNGWRSCDTRLLSSLPGKLAPFAELSPLLYAIWQSAIGACEMMFEGRLERARQRFLALLERLVDAPERDRGYVEMIRLATAHGIASIEVVLGYTSVEPWIAIMEQSPLYQVNALFLRRVQCIFEGDSDAAERLRRQAEVLAAQSFNRQVFDVPLAVELHAQVHAGDLSGVKHTAERGARLAAQYPGWRALHHAAQGNFQHLRGDLLAAKREFEQALVLSDPDRGVDPPPVLRAWIAAVTGYIKVLTELGQAEAACRFGADAIARCEALEISDGYAHIRALALAEAKAGHQARAERRLDQLVGRRLGMNPALLAADWEARALVAIWGRDQGTAMDFAQLALRSEREPSTPLQLARRGRLLDEAARAGVSLDIPASGFESVVLGQATRPAALRVDAKLSVALDGLRDPATRAQRALELFCAAAAAKGGQLYARRADALAHSAKQGAALEPTLEHFVQGYFRQQLEQLAMSTVFTAVEQAAGPLALAEWTSPAGVRYSIALLRPIDRDEYLGAVALLAPAQSLRSPEFATLVAVVGNRLFELEAGADRPRKP